MTYRVSLAIIVLAGFSAAEQGAWYYRNIPFGSSRFTNIELIPKATTSTRTKKSTVTTICVEIKPERNGEDPYYICKEKGLEIPSAVHEYEQPDHHKYPAVDKPYKDKYHQPSAYQSSATQVHKIKPISKPGSYYHEYDDQQHYDVKPSYQPDVHDYSPVPSKTLFGHHKEPIKTSYGKPGGFNSHRPHSPGYDKASIEPYKGYDDHIGKKLPMAPPAYPNHHSAINPPFQPHNYDTKPNYIGNTPYRHSDASLEDEQPDYHQELTYPAGKPDVSSNRNYPAKYSNPQIPYSYPPYFPYYPYPAYPLPTPAFPQPIYPPQYYVNCHPQSTPYPCSASGPEQCKHPNLLGSQKAEESSAKISASTTIQEDHHPEKINLNASNKDHDERKIDAGKEDEKAEKMKPSQLHGGDEKPPKDMEAERKKVETMMRMSQLARNHTKSLDPEIETPKSSAMSMIGKSVGEAKPNQPKSIYPYVEDW